MLFFIVPAGLWVSWDFFLSYSKNTVYSFTYNCQSNFCPWPVNESEEAFNGSTNNQVKEVFSRAFGNPGEFLLFNQVTFPNKYNYVNVLQLLFFFSSEDNILCPASFFSRIKGALEKLPFVAVRRGEGEKGLWSCNSRCNRHN